MALFGNPAVGLKKQTLVDNNKGKIVTAVIAKDGTSSMQGCHIAQSNECTPGSALEA
jgi:hypothetical protein